MPKEMRERTAALTPLRTLLATGGRGRRRALLLCGLGRALSRARIYRCARDPNVVADGAGVSRSDAGPARSFSFHRPSSRILYFWILPVTVMRESIHELPVARDLVGRESCPCKRRAARRHPGSSPGRSLTQAIKLLAILGVGTPMTCTSAISGLVYRNSPPRADRFLTPAHDHVLDAADDVDVAIVVHGGQVAGVHPARTIDGLTS